MDWPFVIANGLMCAATLGFAAHVTSGRTEAVLLSLYLCLNWVQYIAAWSPCNPTELLYRAGLPFESNDLWMLVDAIGGTIAVTIGFRHRWAWALWVTALAQFQIHIGYRLQYYGFADYSRALDHVLMAQCAIFFLIGGPGVWNRLVGLYRKFMHWCRSRRGAAQAQSRRAAGTLPWQRR